MNENEQKKNGPGILVLIILIAVLFCGIKLIFWGLAVVLPTPEQSPAQSISADQSMQIDASIQAAEADLPAPSYCPNCGEKLPDSFQWGQYCPYCGEKVER